MCLPGDSDTSGWPLWDGLGGYSCDLSPSAALADPISLIPHHLITQTHTHTCTHTHTHTHKHTHTHTHTHAHTCTHTRHPPFLMTLDTFFRVAPTHHNYTPSPMSSREHTS